LPSFILRPSDAIENLTGRDLSKGKPVRSGKGREEICDFFVLPLRIAEDYILWYMLMIK
jgi:hypothetical protein